MKEEMWGKVVNDLKEKRQKREKQALVYADLSITSSHCGKSSRHSDILFFS